MKRKIISSICALTMVSASMTSLAGTAVSAADDTLYVLSGNTFTDADKTLYAGEGITLNNFDTGASYTWSADSDAEIREFDDYGKDRKSTLKFYGDEMIGGNISNADQKYLTWTAWNPNVYSTAQFDLKEVYSVSAVDVWGLSQNNSNAHFWQLGDIQIYAGETRDNMKLVWQGNAKTMTAEEAAMTDEEAAGGAVKKKMIRTPATFDAVNARYINVKFNEASNVTLDGKTYGVYQARVSEMVIFGTSPYNDTQIQIKKTLAKADEYLAGKNYYTSDSVAALSTAAEDLRALDAAVDDLEIINFYIEETETAISNLTPADIQYTLSGNKWTSYDTTRFYSVWDPDMVLVNADNSPSYTWAKGADAEAAKVDASCTYLNMGSIRNGTSETWTSWDAQNPMAVVFNLGKKYPIDRVDFVQDVFNSNHKFGYAEVYVSDDGVNYTKVAGQVGNNGETIDSEDDSTHHYNLTTVKFPLKKAQYVLLVMTRGGHSLRITETAIFGYISDMTVLENTVTEAEKYLLTPQYYTAEAILGLQAAVDAAKALTEDSSNAEIVAAAENLNSLIMSLETVNPRLVVSGNTWYNGDIEDYKGLTPSVDLVNASNNPSYTWADGSSSDCLKNDPNCTKLKAGNLQNMDGANGTGTKWGDSQPGIALWDLGATCVIDRVDVFSAHEHAKQLGSVSVSVSEDGQNFTEIKTVAAAGEYTEAQAVYMTTVKFAPVKARYVKVTCNKAASTDTAQVYMTNINEMVIFGIGADYSALSDEIAKYDETALNTLKEFATEESYAAFVSAIETGKAMIAEQSGTRDEIVAAAEDINSKFENIVYVETEGILTNNLVTDTDRELYPGFDNLNVGMYYEILSADSAVKDSLVGNDPGFIKLTKGSIRGKDGNECTYGKWDGDSPATIILDATEEVYFTGADLYEWALNDRGVKSIDISVSSDGVEYKDIMTIPTGYTPGMTGIDQNGSQILNKIGSDFIPVKGRYLKIVSSRRGSQQVLAEVVVKGFRAPKTLLFPLSFGQSQYVIMDMEANELQDLAGADLIDVSGTLINESDAAVTGKVVTAVYSAERKLIAVEISDEYTIDAGAHQAWSNTMLDLKGLPEGAQLVNYVWNSAMRPLAEAQTK